SPGAAANTSVRSAGWCSRKNRCSIAISSSSGVPIPTNPDTDMVSPSRIIAIASSTETILFLSIMALLTLGEPLGDAGAEKRLRFSADKYTDVPAGQGQLRVILGPDLRTERLGGGGRNDVVVLGEHVEHRHGDVAQINSPPADHERVVDQLVGLIQLLEPL